MARLPEPLAHSANGLGEPQFYREHVSAVVAGATANADRVLRHRSGAYADFRNAVALSAEFHDLGKLDPESQQVLRTGKGRLGWDHIDAGVAHLMSGKNEAAAWLVRAHHAPGLPSHAAHFEYPDAPALRGRRRDEDDFDEHEKQRTRTDATLADLVAAHQASLGTEAQTAPAEALTGLSQRLALSCLVDADHSDTARHETGRAPTVSAVEPRWAERLAHLNGHVAQLASADASERDQMRQRFYLDCRDSELDAPVVSCEGPVGIGKTTAVTAFLLARAETLQLRRLFLVAPYTSILTQTAERLRDALTLPGENPFEVVVEHHHRADFEDQAFRELAVLWRAPVVVTTAVQFFETLSSNRPSTLRKLHELPGSAIFLDEAHAALPVRLWKQNLEWLREIGRDWNCRIVLASGSLARFWEDASIVADAASIPELLAPDRAMEVFAAERSRVRYEHLRYPSPTLADFLDRLLAEPGPRVAVFNTVQTAAIAAQAISNRAHRVFHISTALCPDDRAAILEKVKEALRKDPDGDWTLVGTSCIEAGLDLSFRTGFRERFSIANLLQLAGRVNRHGERDIGAIYDFALMEGEGVTAHPGAKIPARVVAQLFKEGEFDRLVQNPADLVTEAMRRELAETYQAAENPLFQKEREGDYPEVARVGRVIDSETCTVVVRQDLIRALEAREHVDFRTLQNGSVQLWAPKVATLALLQIRGRDELYACPNEWYDPNALGIMEGILENRKFVSAGGAIL